MTTVARWRKSSRSSGGSGDNCVEVHGNLDAIRDSKNPAGPVLRGAARHLVAAVKAGRLSA